ncbi:hypothetical protein QTP86_015068 [Hemibagrus guttatus]|nr:hypothetical protein QTP86_015068 [Hemibagrus guttatus]
MATYVDILKSEFPEIDTEVFDYITGVLDSGGSDFEDGEEVFDAVGGVLQEVAADKNEDDIRNICLQLFNTLKINNCHSNQRQVLLDAPVQLSQISAESESAVNDVQGIWMVKRAQGTTVDAKKLEKAEAKLRAKHERRNEKDSQKPANPLVLGEASASQASSKKESRVDMSGKNRSYDIRIENFDVTAAGSRAVFGERFPRYGLIGRNGLGKTTLLKMLANRSLRVPRAHLHLTCGAGGGQERHAGAAERAGERHSQRGAARRGTLALTHTSPTEREAEGTESLRLSEIYAKLEEIEADKAPARASVILAGLGFSPRMQQQPTKEFSGGWRMRLALARALFARPDLLLLDEPTNMLDIRAILWLENYLQMWQSTILVVSHDRNFLNAVATDIIHLHSQRLDSYHGDYENFIKTKEDRLKNQQREYEAQLQYREHIQVFIDRFRYNANRAAQVQSKLKLLEKLPELKPIEKETEVILRFPDNFEKLSPPILQLDEVEFYYTAQQQLFSSLCVSADLDSRICIVGENGAGKSTLLKLLMGDLTPVSGTRHAHRNLKIGYFSQHHVDQLDLNVCSVELFSASFPCVSRPGRTEEEYRRQLGRYGISGELATRPVASLSGGQKSRVAFAQMTMPCPNFYILDEPTNHLDMETIEALAKSLNTFKAISAVLFLWMSLDEGGVVLVSHDERLIRLVCKELWVCEAGRVHRVDGGFDEYKNILQEQFRKEGYL